MSDERELSELLDEEAEHMVHGRVAAKWRGFRDRAAILEAEVALLREQEKLWAGVAEGYMYELARLRPVPDDAVSAAAKHVRVLAGELDAERRIAEDYRRLIEIVCSAAEQAARLRPFEQDAKRLDALEKVAEDWGTGTVSREYGSELDELLSVRITAEKISEVSEELAERFVGMEFDDLRSLGDALAAALAAPREGVGE